MPKVQIDVNVEFNPLNDHFCSKKCQGMEWEKGDSIWHDTYYPICILCNHADLVPDIENYSINGIYEYFYLRDNQCLKRWQPKNDKPRKIPPKWEESDRIEYLEHVKK